MYIWRERERERDELDHELDHLRVGFKFHIRWLHFNSFMSCEHLWMEPWSRCLRSRLRLGHADGRWDLGMAWHGMTSIENKLSQISLELLSYVKISRLNFNCSKERISLKGTVAHHYPSFMRDGFAMLRLGHPNTEREVTTKRIKAKVLFVYFATFWKALKG